MQAISIQSTFDLNLAVTDLEPVVTSTKCLEML